MFVTCSLALYVTQLFITGDASGVDCWGPCKGGNCSWCANRGHGDMCCRKGWKDDPEECRYARDFNGVRGHNCVKRGVPSKEGLKEVKLINVHQVEEKSYNENTKATLAVDGNYETCSETHWRGTQYWEADFEGWNGVIEFIEIYLPTWNDAKSLNGGSIYIGDNLCVSNISKVQTGNVDQAENIEMPGLNVYTCSSVEKATGNKIRIQRNGGYLTLCEVKVYTKMSATCECTGDNSAIPSKQKKFANTDYGKHCSDWDTSHRYCRNERALAKGNRSCWCPKSWCYVGKDCETGHRSSLFESAELYYSYDACGNSADQCFGDWYEADKEFKGAVKEEEEVDEFEEHGVLLGFDPDVATYKDMKHAIVTLADIIADLVQRIEILEGGKSGGQKDYSHDKGQVPDNVNGR